MGTRVDNLEERILELEEQNQKLKQDISDLVYRLKGVKANLSELPCITIGNINNFAKSQIKSINETIDNISFKPMLFTIKVIG